MIKLSWKVAVFSPFLLFVSSLLLISTLMPPLVQPNTVLAAEKGGATWKQQWDKIVTEAKKEGDLTIYTTANGTEVRKICAAFTEKYGIKVDVLSARGPELVQKLDTQRRAGMYSVDLVIAGGMNLVFEMKPRGFLDRFDEMLILPEIADTKAWLSGSFPFIDKDHYGINIVASIARPFIRNTGLVKEGVIESYKDLLKPRWKGKIVMSDPTIAGSSNALIGVLATVWGVENTREFLKQLIKQDLAITRDLRQQVEWVARGKYDLGVGAHGATVAEFITMRAPIYPVIATEGSGVTSMSYGLGILNKRPNPNAAAIFTNWILSREGTGILVHNARLPGARIDSPREGILPVFFPQPGEKFFIAKEEDFKKQKEMLNVAKDVFKPALK